MLEASIGPLLLFQINKFLSLPRFKLSLKVLRSGQNFKGAKWGQIEGCFSVCILTHVPTLHSLTLYIV